MIVWLFGLILVAAGCDANGSPRAQPARPHLDGVYTVTTTADDLEEANGFEEDVPENYGEWVYVINGDRLAFSQQSKDACTWGYGTFTVRGQIFDWAILNGGATVAPNNAVNKPGEFFSFGWSLFRDTLTLTPAKGSLSPANFRMKPWRRISMAPSAKYFHRGCPPPPNALG
jgi:hypothetical protein